MCVLIFKLHHNSKLNIDLSSVCALQKFIHFRVGCRTKPFTIVPRSSRVSYLSIVRLPCKQNLVVARLTMKEASIRTASPDIALLDSKINDIELTNL